MKYKVQRELVEGLRDLADFIEQNIDLPIDGDPEVKLVEWIYDDDDRGIRNLSAKQKMANIARVMGTADKVFSGDYFDLRKKFGPHVTLEFTAMRNKICRAVVVGTKEIPERVVVHKARVEEEIEWVCDEPLLAN